MGFFSNLFKKKVVKEEIIAVVEDNTNFSCEVLPKVEESKPLIPEYLFEINLSNEQKNNIYRTFCELEIIDNKAIWLSGTKKQSLGFSTFFIKPMLAKQYVWMISVKNDDLYFSKIRAGQLIVFKKYSKKNIKDFKYKKNLFNASFCIVFSDNYQFCFKVTKNIELFPPFVDFINQSDELL